MRRLGSNNKAASCAYSISIDECLAKSWKTENGVLAGRSVLNHCVIVGMVAKELLKRWPLFSKSLFSSSSPLIAACHDIGKASPTFQYKIYNNLKQKYEDILSAISNYKSLDEYNWGGHAGVSKACLNDILKDETIAEIVGKHHGYTAILGGVDNSSGVLGGNEWKEIRLSIVENIKQELGLDFPKYDLSEAQANLIAGLTSVADWVGSGSLFENPEDNWQEIIEKAVNDAGFIEPIIKQNLSFEEIFGFKPNEIQKSFIEEVSDAGLYILEAPMGIGKTEAALYAAYLMLEKQLARGIYFALPTRLTSEKIHERMNQFLNAIIDNNSVHKQSLLLHSQSKLINQEMGEEGSPSGSWYNSSKRSILAPFATGTIDQALMSVMNVKHGFVRSFGLAGKVVILDEIHTYDDFTGTILDSLIENLLENKCTVILLSATLTASRRAKFIKHENINDAYPLISVKKSDNKIIEKEINCLQDSEVKINIINDLNIAINEAIERASLGQQVLFVENTVNEAQNLFKNIISKVSGLNIECGLIHSRFASIDRSISENKWINIYGKGANLKRQAKGRILIGTQVLEQSIDIDADFLISRLAPTDMLLQRIGRLWRHESTIRPKEAKRECWIIAPRLDEAIADKNKFGNSAFIYSPYVLARTLEVWQNLSSINVPSQIRGLIEATYLARNESGNIANYLKELEGVRQKLRNMALIGISKNITTLPEEAAQTRYSEEDTTNVLLLKSFQIDDKNKQTSLTLINGEKLILPFNNKKLDNKIWREYSALLMQSSLSVRSVQAPKIGNIEEIKKCLGNYIYVGNKKDGEDVLRIGIIGKDEAIRTYNNDDANNKYQIYYNDLLGYQAIKQAEL